jgi:threonine/homoserine/homoserine lactone efflux protein
VIIVGAGIKIFLSNPVKDFRNKEKVNKSLWRDYYSTLALSISNPYTILIFVAFFSEVHTTGGIKPEFVPFFLIPGVVIGTIAWWFFLSYFVSRFKKRIRLRGIVRVNKVSGIAIIVIGIVLLLSAFTTLKL